MSGKTFDPLCHELASYFLADEPAALQSDDAKTHLALQIQQCIEDEIELMRNEFEGADGVKPC